MRFEIKVQSRKEHALQLDSRPVGLTDLDLIRRAFPDRIIEPKDVCGTLQKSSGDQKFEISEAVARQCSETFSYTSQVIVHTPKGLLNSYAYRVATVDNEPETPEYFVEARIDVDKFLRDWIKAGCPLDIPEGLDLVNLIK